MKTLLRLLLLFIALLPFQLKAQNSIVDAIKLHRVNLHYPLSVQRFYQQEGFRLIWLTDTVKTQVWDAMIILDCVLQYGLTPVNYHQKELTYDQLYLAQSKMANDHDKAVFDVIMTDAIITLINNLHYGKLNPDFPVKRIDAEDITEFKGDKILLDALQFNELMNRILNVQPHSEAYTNLQYHMMLLTTKYSGNNYVKPESDIRNMAISMDRLRWINTTGKVIALSCIVKDGVITYSR
jgi:hypothetical protein